MTMFFLSSSGHSRKRLKINELTRKVYANTTAIPASMYTRNRLKDFPG
jgi:hypothetical protein